MSAPALEMRGVTFSYAGAAAGGPVLRDVSIEVPEGAFALLVGATGSGKSTLLRLAKPEVAPSGSLDGQVRLFGEDAGSLGPVASARAAGYVFQSPDSQLVCDSVWHELAFALENLGVPQAEMRRRVAETCIFLGMEPLFRARTAELSGGQRQLVALASALAMRPRLLLLDEPTSMLDPLAERDFLSLLFRANRELGVTVLVATHAPEAMADYATCAFMIDGGEVAACEPSRLARPRALPALARPGAAPAPAAACVRVDDAWLRYARDAPWVMRALDLEVGEGEVRALVGANGCGKSTLLSLVAQTLRPQRGRVRNAAAADQALLPQGPRAVLSCETVRDELAQWGRSGRYGAREVGEALDELGLAGCPDRHPYDLSGGQQQLLALEKMLLVRPRLLLLDEPTKGLDDAARAWAARRVAQARDDGTTVLVATHDMGFVRSVADGASLMFDGGVTVTEPVGEFLAGSWLFGGGAAGRA